MKAFVFEPGCVITFLYPRHNFQGVQSGEERRKVRVTSVRDLVDEPLDKVTLESQPLLKRGIVLITGEDLECHEQRSFYLSSMRRIRKG